MTNTDKSLEQLLIDSQNGIKESYDLFLRSVIPYLRKYVAAMTHGGISQEDAVQEILFTIHRALHTYLYPNPALPWVKAIARNKVIDIFRASIKDRVLDSAEKLEESQSILFGKEQNFADNFADLKYFLGTLSAEERQLLHLVKIEGYTFSQIAEQYQEDEGALKVRVHRIVKKLRERALDDLKRGLLTMVVLKAYVVFFLISGVFPFGSFMEENKMVTDGYIGTSNFSLHGRRLN
jgi:RNA polymerase sigma-70 factor (ECF subfamily)